MKRFALILTICLVVASWVTVASAFEETLEMNVRSPGGGFALLFIGGAMVVLGILAAVLAKHDDIKVLAAIFLVLGGGICVCLGVVSLT
ncbi:MAG: hypothetical protein AAB817_00670, partial [Patescibacteria group bacterium]